MPCYHPIPAWRSRHLNPSGKRGIVFNAAHGYLDMALEVPCGQCIGCRLARSRQWAARCIHEAQGHEKKCFVTLTYSPSRLPPGGTLVKKHFQDFMKRLRKRFEPERISYFMCGEYGENLSRPHYHAILYGVDFLADRRKQSMNARGDFVYTSQVLEDLWGQGYVTIGEVTFESAAYVARYCLKKVTGEAADSHYRKVDPETGELYQVESEYVAMSLRPAIGKEWFAEFGSDVFPDDFVVVKGRKIETPAYYDKLLELEDKKLLDRIKGRRRHDGKQNAANNTPERLAVREVCQSAKLKLLKRSVEG